MCLISPPYPELPESMTRQLDTVLINMYVFTRTIHERSWKDVVCIKYGARTIGSLLSATYSPAHLVKGYMYDRWPSNSYAYLENTKSNDEPLFKNVICDIGANSTHNEYRIVIRHNYDYYTDLL